VCSDASSGGPCNVKVGGVSIFQVMISSRVLNDSNLDIKRITHTYTSLEE